MSFTHIETPYNNMPTLLLVLCTWNMGKCILNTNLTWCIQCNLICIYFFRITRNLQESKEFICRCRGEIEVKGKGKMTTFFLIGTSSKRVREPDDEYRDLPVVGDKDILPQITFPKEPKLGSGGKHYSSTCVVLWEKNVNRVPQQWNAKITVML